MDYKDKQNQNARFQFKQEQDQQQKQNISETGNGTGNSKVNFSFKMQDQNEQAIKMRRPRSQTYLDAIAMIDMISATDEKIIEQLREKLDEDTLEEFQEMSKEDLIEELKLSIQEELEKMEIKNTPEKLVGILSECFISGCVVHAIDKTGAICAHYNQINIPEKIKPGYDLYQKIGGNCACIEVYTNCCRVINNDGSVKKEVPIDKME